MGEREREREGKCRSGRRRERERYVENNLESWVDLSVDLTKGDSGRRPAEKKCGLDSYFEGYIGSSLALPVPGRWSENQHCLG